MNKYLLFLLAILLLCKDVLVAQPIPASRRTDWLSPGCSSVFTPNNTVSIDNFGADNTGVLSCNAALTAAIANLAGPGKIVFGAGQYRFTNVINLPDSIVLEGAYDPITKHSASTLILATGSNKHGIFISGSLATTQYPVTQAPVFGNKFLRITGGNAFKVDDFVWIIARDDSTLVSDTWGYGRTGQICRVTAKTATRLTLNKPIRRSYNPARLPVIVKMSPRKQVHLRCLNLIREGTTTTQASNIFFQNAVNCSVEGVSSQYTNYAHVAIRTSAQISVSNCYFTLSLDYGGGGRGYGVMAEHGSSDCYVYHNVFNHLRHSMILQSGANGNVFAYNYSKDPYWTETFLPSNSAGDLVLHGNYPYANLFEGNVVQHIVIDNAHGKNGPLNTFFRNRAELYGLFMNSSPASDSQNIVANQTVNTSSPFLGGYTIAGTGHYLAGNSVKGVVSPAGSFEPSTQTLFGYSFSSFYTVLGSKPAIRNIDWATDTLAIEAVYRYKANNQTSLCQDEIYFTFNEANASCLVESTNDKVLLFPNPYYDGRLFFEWPESNQDLPLIATFYSMEGKLVFETSIAPATNNCIPEKLPSGVYIVTLQNGNKTCKQLLRVIED